MQRYCLANTATDAFWYNVALVLAQFDGLHQGYNDHCAPHLVRVYVRKRGEERADGRVPAV